jgi:ADP-ribose pyrophosphatase YjhB (NUDIX family)
VTSTTRWTPPRRIRPIAIALVKHAGRLLVMEGRDALPARTYYRPLGGGIELGERGEAALRRELREEINAELGAVAYAGTIENIYELEGNLGHEIVLVYTAELADRALYSIETFAMAEGTGRAIWIDVADVTSGAAWLVPDGLLTLLSPTSVVS